MTFWTDTVERYVAFGICLMLMMVAYAIGWKPQDWWEEEE